ncbi:LysR family transcriptional regulator [Selenomonas ruminantium]|uniref:DNA-binding transcriptional regulator, LysR family n=1 Tax=Selenomonas ruminantium TaxID=971 RepID=A0A1I0VQN6_SELRU|nr:LysR family transcriptional regulator [Selenomonas ruminantium]SFA77996.1 DNA-binding transcriptional regulator, LysR family [Selenomonas ruminantium]
MEIAQLKYFLAVCDCKQMTQAAERLFISQSSLSKHISQLEKEVGVPLFDRTGRTLHITTAGMDFAEFARETVSNADDVLRRLRDKTPYTATLNLGTIPVLSQYGLHTKILAFQEKNPHIQLNIVEDRGEEILRMLDGELVELAVLRAGSLPDDSYKAFTLGTDKLVLVCSSNHPLAASAEVHLKDFQQEDFFLLDMGQNFADSVYHACAREGFAPHIRQRFPRMETILGYVAAGAGVSLLLEKELTAFNLRNVAVKKLSPAISSSIALVFPHGRHLSPAAAALRSFLENFTGKNM